ncbi:MAG: hypothetical protein ACOYOK_11565 [Pseudobdellovibrionaceae bacterium]
MNIFRIAITLFIFCQSHSVLADGLLVYIPTTLGVSKIEKKISALTSAKVTGFAKYGDFEAAIEATNPDGIITTAALADSIEGYAPVAGLKINGADKSKYILLSLDPKTKVADPKTKIGSVEFIKRTKVKDYLQKIFGATAIGSVKTVSKVEDLFPLLVFKSVDVVALLPSTYDELKEKFNTTVHEVGSSQEVQPLTLYQKGGGELKKDFEGLKDLDFNSK